MNHLDQPAATGTTAYTAVVNDEGQYALWAAWRPLPVGWHRTGVRGSRQQCLVHIVRATDRADHAEGHSP